MDAKAVKHGLRVELVNPSADGRGVWHVLERSPHGLTEWWLHRWADVTEFSAAGFPTGTRREWQTVSVKASEFQRAYADCHPGDLMDYPQLVDVTA